MKKMAVVKNLSWKGWDAILSFSPDFSRTKFAVAEKCRAKSYSNLSRLPCNEADKVKSDRPKGGFFERKVEKTLYSDETADKP